MEDIEIKKTRPYHRPVMLTVSKGDYIRLRESGSVVADCCNDIIRTSRCGKESVHHWERRYTTVEMALMGGHRNVKVRWCGDCPAILANVETLCPAFEDEPRFRVELSVA